MFISLEKLSAFKPDRLEIKKARENDYGFFTRNAYIFLHKKTKKEFTYIMEEGQEEILFDIIDLRTRRMQQDPEALALGILYMEEFIDFFKENSDMRLEFIIGTKKVKKNFHFELSKEKAENLSYWLVFNLSSVSFLIVSLFLSILLILFFSGYPFIERIFMLLKSFGIITLVKMVHTYYRYQSYRKKIKN